MMKWLHRLGWPVGIAILLVLALHQGWGDVIRTIGRAGFVLLWLVPYHAFPLLLDAQGWRLLLARRASLPFLWWLATVREAVNRLLPVVGVGGELIGIRVARWRVPDASFVTATVIVELLVTLSVQYAFSALGLVLLVAATGSGDSVKTIALSLVLSLPMPVIGFVMLRRGGIFQTIERFAAKLLGDTSKLLRGIDGERLDAEIIALMSRTGLLLRVFGWQFAGYLSGALEIYLALAMLGHPVSVSGAIAIEAMIQAIRHIAFMVPGGVGVQEATIVLLAQLFGVDRETALSLALVRRARELLSGGLALASWQVVELARSRRRLKLVARREARRGEGGRRAAEARSSR
ncbi:lysylphosphatidylglycerol synthase domain-containing protein [Burkholderia perseverans]|uniref:lysylphosphatidylglycerol synthase domain-containing protein n=1 Tax=Burkholderia perseverans TaxID=2615214 RepID=UPI001FEEE8CE|nr:lysylphosphatidylglycerol synthase domain-containing protein [Burkholderia perseverans]